jgi:glycosyltransferase involved in cell wall biosynthesis
MNMQKKDLIFITNIPTPYNLDLFDSLSSYFSLKVYYYNLTENDRYWNLDIKSNKYESFIFKKDFLTSIFNKISTNLYFNIECIQIMTRTNCQNIIISGIYFSPNSILSLIISKFRKKNVFWYGEKINTNITTIKLFFKYSLFSPIRFCANGIFAIGIVAEKSYIKLGYTKQIFNLPYAINNEKFKSVEIADSISSDKFTILSSGSLIHRKGFDILLNAINKLDTDIQKKIRVIILGDGPERNNLNQLKNNNYELFLTGYIEPSRLYSYYKNSDLFVFTSRYDGWGVVTNEALASSLPIIITNTCGSSEYIDIDGGFVIEPDINKLKNCINILFLDQKLRIKMANYNLNKSKEISSDIIAKKLSIII